MAEEKEQAISKRALWSGNVTFGLVSIPVNLLSVNRPRPISLRMLAPDGTPLRRRYFCPREERMLTADEIVRGYELDTDQFVVVSDDELEALAPEKSREIDLRRFVPLEQVDRRYFDRAYMLTPAGDTKKAYLLLAEAMERNRRAGIATFILHGKEHLVAILSENGILHAEILHFADEIRTPVQLDLQVPDMADAAAVEDLAARILAVRHDGFQKEALKDPQSGQLLALVEQKKQTGQDVIDVSEEGFEEQEDPMDEESGAKIIDLMEILKRSLALSDRRTQERPASRRVKAKGNQAVEAPVAEDCAALSHKELYALAQDKNIPGRSRMSDEELAKALSAVTS